MKWTGLNELREQFLTFFETKQHLRLGSFPLVPKGDKSLLLINSGMAPMKKWFLGTEEPPCHRVTTCQKCIRTPDIESVGITDRHGTYFEMLGNFSFQDYFKDEAISWAWEFFTSNEWMDIPKEKLHISVYEEDDDAYAIWTQKIGVSEDHMVRLGKKDNFWEHGSGPCGPCSEIYFDRGETYGCGDENCKAGCECDRFIEVWNLVFTEFDSDGEGNYAKLAKPNIDTGMGLERLACVMQDAPNLFEVDTVQKILHHVEKLSGKTYRRDKKTDISIRVITDHIRSTTLMVSDGVLPSNEGRGYVLRRLLRRAARHGRMLGITNMFLTEVCETVITQNETAYPELRENAAYIKKTIAAEEERFMRTIDAGMMRLNEMMDKAAVKMIDGSLSGVDAFLLHDTFGFPLDLTKEIAAEAGFTVDEETFREELKKQRDKARKDRASREIAGWESDVFGSMQISATEFLGYDTLKSEAKVLGLAWEEEVCDAVSQDEGEKMGVLVVLDKTPFYAQGGGQVADTGYLRSDETLLLVQDVKKTTGDLYVHVCTLQVGTVKTGQVLSAEVDTERREAIMRNHTSAHLVQKALTEVLGDHVRQAGSYVDEERMRFDFTHFSAMTPKEIKKVEHIVNEKIMQAMAVCAENMSIEKAKEMGATALFGEKYGDVVRVVDAGGWSTELCGGTHVDNTGRLGAFKIISESSVAAGVRRIESTTGFGVLRILDEREMMLSVMAKTVKSSTLAELPSRLSTLMEENKKLQKELSSVKDKAANAQAEDMFKNPIDINGTKVFTAFLKKSSADTLRKMCDLIKNNEPMGVGALIGESDGKMQLAVCCGEQAVKSGLKAGALAKEIAMMAGGNGGGKPDFAMAGIKDASKVEEALAAVPDIVKSQMS